MKTCGLYKTKIRKKKTVLPEEIIKGYKLSDGDTVDWLVEKGKVTINFPEHSVKLSELAGKIDMGKTNREMIDEIVND
ncbi:hypothetical protein BEH94_07060 [Candidatus Altiarchaeales archaeon WOR_SM1_SCG]|nr:hypothetical protein BEH94_07060 [Candidatus Altiarchaeales archaeon WOR_SM1_SCG]